MEILISFQSEAARLDTAGGKGANLARLRRSGFPVPHGWIISTAAYREFVDANRLQPLIQSALRELASEGTTFQDLASPELLERASATIRTAFTKGKLPAALEAAIRIEYAKFGGAAVAVRSSATAEDLPDLSFAGQQDTFLNVLGEQQLFKAVIDCWSSLWTARAIGYRRRNNISHDEAALAVVVQEMVYSEASGVLFTANPLTGLLSESVIDATFGLGEALVSGRVEPDHYVVNTLNGELVSRTLGAKLISTRPRAGGGVESLPEAAADRQALSDADILQLVKLGRQIQAEYGAPQDIEWALAGSKLYILQTRLITSLFPLPELSFDPLIVWFSFGTVQGLVGPITPLGQDVIRTLIVGAGGIFGARLKLDEMKYFIPAGERIWVRVSEIMRNPIGKHVYKVVLPLADPGTAQILARLADDPRLGAGEGKLRFRTLHRLSHFGFPLFIQALRNMLRPETVRPRFDAAIQASLEAAQISTAENRYDRLANTVAFLKTSMLKAFPYLLPKFAALMAPCIAGINILSHLSEGQDDLTLELMRALPNNVTIEMDLALWKAATSIKREPLVERLFRESHAQELARLYLERALPPVAQAAITGFMETYGMRGVGEFDYGQPRWREDPLPVMHTLKSYLDIAPEFAPDAMFARGVQAAGEAVEKLAAQARRQPAGRFKEKLARLAARRIRLLMGARESPKFYLIRMMGISRRALLSVEQEFLEAGTIERAGDLAFLHISELESLSRRESRDWKALIAGRRLSFERELRRRQTPRVIASDGRAFYEGMGAETDTGSEISGSPVSPGVVEGIVHVVLDPRGVQLAPGEILVCPGTDPAWTPLFMTAGGLVTEVGGMMTHGSVVAREYGIPAVVGVHQATLRLKDGQRIRVDGTKGKIYELNN